MHAHTHTCICTYHVLSLHRPLNHLTWAPGIPSSPCESNAVKSCRYTFMSGTHIIRLSTPKKSKKLQYNVPSPWASPAPKELCSPMFPYLGHPISTLQPLYLCGCEANPSPLLTMRILTRSIAQHLRCDTQAAKMAASHLASEEIERIGLELARELVND